MSSFTPGIASAQEAGLKVTRAPYADGLDGHKQSLEEMAAKIREGRFDPDVMRWASDAVPDGRNQPSVRARTEAILNAQRSFVKYRPDPVGAEVVQSAATMLCLRKNLCIRAGDCDDQVILLCSMLLSVGIDAVIVKEDYEGAQSHVYVAVHDGRVWFYCDPSTNRAPFDGPSTRAINTQYVDPMKDAPVEIVGIGKPPSGHGVGAPPGNWIADPTNTVQAGLRYAVGIVAPATWTAATAASYFTGAYPDLVNGSAQAAPAFLVETVQPGTTTGMFTSWVMIGVARASATLVNGLYVTIAGVLQEAPPASTAIVPAPTTGLVAPPVGKAIDVKTAALWAVGVAAAGGIGWGLWRTRKKR